jgi:transcriptional regulator with XRE-family HTH domain
MNSKKPVQRRRAEVEEPSAADARQLRLQSTIAARIRFFRLQRQMTGVALASAAGITKGMLSQVESASRMPSVPVLASIAEALSVTVGDLFGGSAATFEPVYTPAGCGRQVSYPEPEGIAFEVLSTLRFPNLEVRALIAEPGRRWSKRTTQFDGFWIDHVLTGELVLRVGGREYVLRPGDTLTYRGEVPHEFVRATPGTRVLGMTGQFSITREPAPTSKSSLPA